jgi:hypothetical protein
MSQESSDRSCSCCCSQCPPWWVTMGFIPPLQATQAQPKAAAPTPQPTPAPTPPVTPQPATPAQPSSGGGGNILTGLLGDVAGLF